jgi:ABC-type nitrate/sulfonate/bicarbonate transport system ATPase subunit
MLRLHIKSKSFRAASGGVLPVLGLIDLTLGAREIVALVGPSGCGKTTLLRIVGGLDRAFDGSLTWGRGEMPRIGTVFQEPRLLPWRTVMRNILLAQRHADPTRAIDLLRTLGLSAFGDAWPGTLSLGMARRVAIARAFAVEPDLVLLDEPFVSLDPDTALRGRALLLETWRTRPTAVLVVTHDRAEAAALADRILFLGGTPTRVVNEVVVPAAERRLAG